MWGKYIWMPFLGLIPGFLGFLNWASETWIWITQIVELKKSFKMIPNSNQFPGKWIFKIQFSTFAWAIETHLWVLSQKEVYKKGVTKVPLILHLKMTSLKNYITWVILRTKQPRIWVTPTRFQRISKNFKIEFSGHWTKICISSGSAWFTESFQDFSNIKICHIKKLYEFPEFNLAILSDLARYSSIGFAFQFLYSNYTDDFPRYEFWYRVEV